MEAQFLEELYNKTINTLLIGFDQEEYPEIMSSYKKYLINNYKNVLEPEDDIQKVIDLFIEIENKKWSTKSKKEKQIFIIHDESLENLKRLSELAEKYAKKRLGNEIDKSIFEVELTEVQVKDYIKKLEEYSNSVKVFNKEIALSYLSEGTLDFLYAAKLSDVKSLRINRI